MATPVTAHEFAVSFRAERGISIVINAVEILRFAQDDILWAIRDSQPESHLILIDPAQTGLFRIFERVTAGQGVHGHIIRGHGDDKGRAISAEHTSNVLYLVLDLLYRRSIVAL